MIDIITGTDGVERLTGTESNKGGKIAAVVLLLCAVGAAAGGVYWYRAHNKPVTVDLKASEQAVKDADVQWSQAAQAHNMGTLASFYADDATVLPPNADMITSKLGALKYWSEHLTKDVDVSWKPMFAEAAQSGDLVYTLGSYTMTTKPAEAAKGAKKGAKGAPVTDHGKYMAVWKKQADGTWKAEVDMWNSDLPAKK